MLKENYKLTLDSVTLWEYRKALSGEGSVLRIDKDKGKEADDLEAIDSVYDDYLKRFGLGDRYEHFTDIQMQLIDAYSDYIENDNRFALNLIRRLEGELTEILNRNTGGTLDDAIIVLTKWIGTYVNEREWMAKDFFTALERLENEQKEIKAKQHGKDKED